MTQERKEKLKHRVDWARIDEAILTIITDGFESCPDDYFEQFLKFCETYGLVQGAFLELPKNAEPDSYAWLLALKVHEQGKKLMEKDIQSRDGEYLVIGTMAHYFSTLLEKEYFPGYISLACGFARGGNYQQALEYLAEGRRLYTGLKESAQTSDPLRKEILSQYNVEMLDELKEEFVRQCEGKES